MIFFKLSPTKKHKQVIRTVMAYFNEETTHIPYSPKQINKTLEWLTYHKPDQSHLLKERLAMAAKISSAQHGALKTALL